MKKRLILITTILAIVSGALFAAQVVDNTPNYTDAEMSVSGDEGSTVVADAANVAMVFDLEAKTGDTTWANANGYEVYDETWDVRAPFDAYFRLYASDGSYDSATPLTITVEVGNLYRNGETTSTEDDYYDAGAGVVSAATLGGNFATATYSPSSNLENFAITTKANHYYGVSSTTADDSLTFKLSYDGNANAPAGRYKSEVTVSYAAQ